MCKTFKCFQVGNNTRAGWTSEIFKWGPFKWFARPEIHPKFESRKSKLHMKSPKKDKKYSPFRMPRSIERPKPSSREAYFSRKFEPENQDFSYFRSI